MSESNRDRALRWMEEVWNQRRDELVDEMMATDAVGYVEGGTVTGRAEFRAFQKQLLTAFPDFQVTVEDSIEDGDRVALRWRVTGTHHGDNLGFKATGAPVGFRGMTWFRFENGWLVEGWDAWNQGHVMATLQALATV